MESIIAYFNSLNIDLPQALIVGAVFLIGVILIASIGRFIFGKKSTLGVAVSSTFGIVFIYLIAVLLRIGGSQFAPSITPLPFVAITDEALNFHVLTGEFSYICAELLNMIILAFLVNLADRWLPKGKKLLSWIFFRIVTVALGYLMYVAVNYAFDALLLNSIAVYAPMVMLAILILLLLTGALKILVGAVLSISLGPLVGALYTFFFANIIGKLVTRAVLTTAIITGLVYLLNHLGIFAISIISTALIAYIPFLVLLVIVWYITNKII